MTNITKEEYFYLASYLIDYLNGDFNGNIQETRYFIQLCKKEYPENKNIKQTFYRAIRIKDINEPIKTLTSSHKRLMSTSENPTLAAVACYGFGVDLKEDIEEVRVYEISNVVPLLTYDQIFNIVNNFNNIKWATIARTIKEREVLIVHTPTVFKNAKLIENQFSLDFIKTNLKAQKDLDTSLKKYIQFNLQKIS